MTDGELVGQVDTIKSKNNFLMEENKDLKKRIREVMQIETEYQDTTVALKVCMSLNQKRVSDLERALQKQSSASQLGTGSDDANRGMLEKRYDDMKKYYEGRIKELERDNIEYKDMNNRLISKGY